VKRGQAAVFTNKCLHSGGENDGNSDSYRLFAYVTHEQSDIPNGTVRIFGWDSSGHIVCTSLDRRSVGDESEKEPALPDQTEQHQTAMSSSLQQLDDKKYNSPTQSSNDKENVKDRVPAQETDTTEQTDAEQSARDEADTVDKESSSSTQSSNDKENLEMAVKEKEHALPDQTEHARPN
jgi:hypothetical protein